jgi:hypothetical protein
MKSLAIISSTVQQNFLFRLYKFYIFDSILIVKRGGFKELIKQRGWKIFWIVGGYYLVRDTVVYIIIPYCIARGIF